MLGSKLFLSDYESIANKRRCLSVSATSVEIVACPRQKIGPICLACILLVLRKQMRRELGAKRPRRRFGSLPMGYIATSLRNQSPDGILRRTVCLRPRSCHGLHETMHRHRRRGVLKGVVLQKRDLGERGERFHALHFVLNRALDQRHWDALGRTLGEIGHKGFRRWALCHCLGDGEVESRGDAPWIACAARRSVNKARSLLCIVGEAHLRALAVGRRMVESERQATQSLRKRLAPAASLRPARLSSRATASSGGSTSSATSSATSLQSENRDVMSTRAPADGRRSAM